MADQTIRQLNAAPTVQQPLCITFPQGDTPFQLKTGLIHLLPTFNGLPSESPHKHLAEFHMVCNSMKPQGVSEDQIKLRAFPFSLAGTAKEWLFYLPPNSINTWSDLSRVFLDRYFPVEKATEIRRNILGIQQMHDESLYEYWERFKKLCASCPQHGLSEQTLIQYLYEGMLPMDKKMVDAASGGALVNMTPTAARTLISTMAANSQQFGSASEPSRRVQTVSTISLENKIDNLTNIVHSLVSGEIGAAKVCEICTMQDHATDLCPLLRDMSGAQVNAIHNFPGPLQRPYNPQSNTFNPGWRDHPNLSYGNRNPNFQTRQQPPYQNQASQKSSLESIVERLAVSQEKFQTQTQSHLQELDKQVSQLAQIIGRLESQGKLPSQTEINPRENVSKITLRNGTVITPKLPKKDEQKSDGSSEHQNEKSPSTPGNIKSKIPISTYEHVPPFPGRLAKRDKKEEEKEIMEVFKKVEINIPLLDVIRKVPKYAKFLKDLCTNRRRLSGNERVNLSENILAIFQKPLPPKYKDQGMFAIPCKIGNVGIKRAMCDLGASINVMPLSVYRKISMDPLKETKVTIQLADRSIIYPEGVLENILVKVNNLIFPADFYIIDMENDHSNNGSEIFLGRPFLSTAHTKIDVRNGILTMEFDGEVVKFDVYKAMKYPESVASLNFVDIIDPLANDLIGTDLFHDFCRELEDLNDDDLGETISTLSLNSELQLTPSESKPLPSILQAPQLELKQLPPHLKYAYLGDKETLPVIISSELSSQQEEELIAILSIHKEVIGWTLADIKGLSPSTCMHKIKVEEGAKPIREGQRRLNPPMMDVVRQEIKKLLDADIIYAISDSKWVSPIHVVPKITGITVVENDEGERSQREFKTDGRCVSITGNSILKLEKTISLYHSSIK
ncbi:hypothetical protein HRI_001766300 [Hibiscus trionum]|uniref:Retrotransposon gag domain-containing protein n=1 Tax=Hibiscus trionum TaxID=183268 RepID=A0A9W7HN80_HIBTR|nr:hypothetical protein HRI_001766300 [Hibiscus trionum]